MLATIEQKEENYIVRFERRWDYPVEQVWAWLTENEKLVQWFPELQIEELREGGYLKFDMQDGTFVDMKITALAAGKMLEYEWGGDRVRFELTAVSSGGCRLALIETIKQITPHTPKDLAGWDVCMDVIAALLAGEKVDDRMSIWKVKYEQYVKLLEGCADM
ncbi:SRPBCC family protein [Paenibacillus sp. GCM10027626]|uniref:SRPBCC family protein n=1 Tax=Paenibacillus sp. GCM10027626 TaxID=3273411 RepID=UPI003645BF13